MVQLLQAFSVIVVCFFLATVESQTTVTVYPPSVGAQNGEVNVYLGCNVTGLTPTYYVQWTYYPAWHPTGFLIYTTYNNVTRDPSNFTVNAMPIVGDTQSVDLVINRLKPELAAQYQCDIAPIPFSGKSINVIALDPLECPSGGIVKYDEYDVTNISCSVNFYDSSQNPPIIMWYRDGLTVSGVEVIAESSTRRTARMAKNVTSLDDNQEFVCVVEFPNANPDYTENCSTVFYVIYSVSQIDFYPPSSADAPTQIAVGDTINCIANGRPAPWIEWYDFDYNFLSDLSEMVVTEEMRNWPQPITLYCRANNSIDNGLTVALYESNYTFEAVRQAAVTVYPPSVGAQNGEVNVGLACNATGLISTYYVQWIYYPSLQFTGILIYSTYNNINSDPSNFTVNAMPIVGDTQSVDLVINRLKPELAVQYYCEITTPFGTGKFITVIALDPLECPSGGIVECDEYNMANISCSVNFYQTTLQNPPSIMWYRDGLTVSGVEIIAESNTRLTARFALNVTSADDGQEFICIVEFPNSDPDYTDNCSTVIKVMQDPCNFYTGYGMSSTLGSATDDPCSTLAESTTEITSTLPTSAPATSPTTSLPTTSTAKTTTLPHDPCNPSPCRNGATCNAIGNTSNCICTPSFTAQNCEVEINECESSPCYPFGKCTDLIGDYNCTCNPGYQQNNTKLCTETDFCAMENQPCYNDGTCVNQNALSRYYCLCPILDGKEYVGLKCETVLITEPMVNGGISPTSGIIAGGANVTINGQGLDLFEPLGAYLIDKDNGMPSLYAYVIPSLTRYDSIVVRIPPAHFTYAERSLLVTAEYTGPRNITSEPENLFKYTGNPNISTIEPTEILVSGGVHLTVSGTNLNTVQQPMMDITTYVVNKTTGGNPETNHSRSICTHKNTSSITCLVPLGIVPSSFFNGTKAPGETLLGVGHLVSSFRHKRGGRTKRAPVANLTDDDGNTFQMYIGFILDEYPTYNNISKSLPHVSLSLVSLKVNFEFESDMDFVSNKDDTISIYGSDLNYGCSAGDYVVTVSNAPCPVTHLTSNELQCQPPKAEPPRNDSGGRCTSAPAGSHPVVVYIGGGSQTGGCVKYTTDNTDLIIGVTVTCVTVVIIIILVAVLVYKRHRKNQKKGLTMSLYLRQKLAGKGGKQKQQFDNPITPMELVEESDRTDHRAADVHQTKEEPDSSGPSGVHPRPTSYLVAKDGSAMSTSDRSHSDADPGETVQNRYQAVTMHSALNNDNDYLKPIDGLVMPNSRSNSGLYDNVIVRRSRGMNVHVDNIRQLSFVESGNRSTCRPISEPEIDYHAADDIEVDYESDGNDC